MFYKNKFLPYILFLLILFFSLIYYYYHYTDIYVKFKSKNIKKHRNSDSLYAHFSAIDDYNYFLFPKLIFAHPIYFKLKKNESIYIPKNWWHWIKTTSKSFAINYWFNNKNNRIESKPFIFKNTLINYNHNILKDEMVTIWDSKNNITDKKINFDKFYNSGIDNNYVITLENYNLGYNNKNIKDKMKPYINFPSEFKLYNNLYDYNIWASSGKHDTGLHYDDDDGILQLIDGEKDIIMFPPSDSTYLYPYKISYEWLSNNAYNYRYNSYKKFEKIKGKSSSELLYETCKTNPIVLSNISKLYNKFNKKDLVWGFKKNKDIYRWEFYNYQLNKSPSIVSYDVFSSEYNIGPEEHHYYNMDKTVKLPFWGYGKYIKNKVLYDESKIFVIDNYESFNNNYDNYMNKLNYNTIKDKFKNIILNKYKCYELCIFNKNSSQIFIMYLGISNIDFLEFLNKNDYPKNIIDFVNSDDYKINNEITIIYDIITLEIVRTSFYGVITQFEPID